MANKILKSLSIAIFLVGVNTICFAQKIGVFDGQDDVGKVLHKGSATYDVSTQSYQLSGAGSNIWVGHDEFQFA